MYAHLGASFGYTHAAICTSLDRVHVTFHSEVQIVDLELCNSTHDAA
jgi:hypothetical protein